MNILIAGGGTGGHLFPALAIGAELKARLPEANIHYVGSAFGLEKTIFPKQKVPYTLLNIRGLQRRLSWQSVGKNLILPFRLLTSWLKTVRLIRALVPVVVIGTGGYASAFPVRQALRTGIPVVLQEQNSYPGFITRRYAAKVRKVCLGFAAARDYLGGIGIETGNPVQRDVNKYSRKKAADYFQLSPSEPVLFITGGSQGSLRINQTIADILRNHKTLPFQILWQTGTVGMSQWTEFASEKCRIYPFIDEMEAAYALSDLIITRAGALALSEIALFGKPSILIPLAIAAENHQYYNGKVLVDRGAAIMIEEQALSASRLLSEIEQIISNHDTMRQMGDAALALARPDALARITDHIMEVIKA